MNKCIFIGRTTSDLEIRHTTTGTAVGSFVLAVDGVRDANGDKTTDFLNMTVWGETAERMANWVKKGTKIAVECRAKQDRWKDDEGRNKSAIKFTVSYWEFCESKGSAEEHTEAPAPQADKDGFLPTDNLDDLPFN